MYFYMGAKKYLFNLANGEGKANMYQPICLVEPGAAEVQAEQPTVTELTP